MAKKSKKTAAKKKNEKKNKERAALARKEVVEQKKAAQVTGNETKTTPQKSKIGVDDKKDKQQAKQEKAKEKQRLKEKKEKEKREAAQKKRQEKIQELKDREKKAEQVKKKGREEPAKPSAKKANKPAKSKKEKTAQTKAEKPKEQKKSDSNNKPAKITKPENRSVPAVINKVAEAETEAVSANIVLSGEKAPEHLAPAEEVMNDSHIVPGEIVPVEEVLEIMEETLVVGDGSSVPQETIEPVAESLLVGNDPCVVPQDIEIVEKISEISQAAPVVGDGSSVPQETIEPAEEPLVIGNAPRVAQQNSLSIADLVRSALSKPVEPTQNINETQPVNVVTTNEVTAQPEPSDITKNPLANLVHSALFKAIEPVEETVVDNNTETTQANIAVEKSVIEPPPVKKQKPDKSKKESKPKNSVKVTLASLTTRLTSVVKTNSKKMSPKAKQVVMIVAAGVLLLAVVAIAVNVFSYNPPKKAVPVYRGLTESSVNVRDIEATREQQLQKVKDTRAKGNTRAFKFFANNEFAIEEWYDQFPLVLGNLDSNKCDFIVTILDGDTIVYRSMGITPGKYLPSIKLFDNMDYGTYELMVVVAGYDPVTFKNIGVQHMKFKLVIGNEQGTQKTSEQTEE